MKRLFKLLIPLLTLSVCLIGDTSFAAKGGKVSAKTETKTEIKQTTPTKINNTQAVLEELRAKLENATTPAPSPRAGEQIARWAMSNGGSWGSSSMWQVGATLGQPTVGEGGSALYSTGSGFWTQGPGESPGCCDLAGDFTNDGSVDITDLTGMVDFMFGGGPPAPCNDEADINGDNTIDISDLTYRVDFMFGGGPVPVCGTTGS